MIFRVRSLSNVQHRRCIVHLSSLSSNVVCDVSTNKGNGIPSDKLNYAAGEKLEYQNNTLSGPMNVLSRMDQQGVRPSVSLYGSILKACAKRKALSHVKIVHAHLAKHGLELDRAVGEILVRTLVKCGDLEGALQLFYRLPYRTVISWTAMISGYTLTGQSRKALRMFERMKGEGIEPNAFTIVSLLKACGTLADLEEGKRIHGEALRNRVKQKNPWSSMSRCWKKA